MEEEPKADNTIVLLQTSIGALTTNEAITFIETQQKMIEEMISDACDECTRKALNKAGYSDGDQEAFLKRIKETIAKAMEDSHCDPTDEVNAK